MGALMSGQSRNEQQAKKFKQLIHVAKNELGLDDDTYRDMLRGLELPESTTKMTLPQLNKVLEHLKRSGFKVRSKPKDRPLADGDQAKMMRGLWLELHSLGYVQNSSETALTSWVTRETKVAAIQWLTVEQAQTTIEKLKQWRWRDERKLKAIANKLFAQGRIPTAVLSDLANLWFRTPLVTKAIAVQLHERFRKDLK